MKEQKFKRLLEFQKETERYYFWKSRLCGSELNDIMKATSRKK